MTHEQGPGELGKPAKVINFATRRKLGATAMSKLTPRDTGEDSDTGKQLDEALEAAMQDPAPENSPQGAVVLSLESHRRRHAPSAMREQAAQLIEGLATSDDKRSVLKSLNDVVPQLAIDDKQWLIGRFLSQLEKCEDTSLQLITDYENLVLFLIHTALGKILRGNHPVIIASRVRARALVDQLPGNYDFKTDTYTPPDNSPSPSIT